METEQLAGTVVKRASLHNEDIINQLDLHIGDQVYVEKAGEIIPQIVGVNTEARSETLGQKVSFIKLVEEYKKTGRIRVFLLSHYWGAVSLLLYIMAELLNEYIEKGIVRFLFIV